MNSLQNLFPFERHYIDLDGTKMHYIDECESRENAPVLVMVHGNPTWSFLWRNLVQHLRTKYRVIALDHVGCGRSDKPQTYAYRLSQHVKNLTTLIEHLGLKDITLFLHDWGGAIGMGYAVRFPRNVKAFVLFNTAAFPSKQIPLRIAICRIPFLGKLLVQGLNGFARGATVMASENRLPRDVKSGYLAPYDSFAHRIATLRFVEDIPMKSSHPSWEELGFIERGLKTLKNHPMLLCWGEKDWCFTLSFLREWQERFPQARSHVFDRAGHLVLEDAGEEILPIVKTFLNEVSQ